MEHKAFLFNYRMFETELKPGLETSLGIGDCAWLKSFIDRNLDELSDPYEGEGLAPGWEDLIEHSDAHQYGDFALTKYYSPAEDIGLGYGWQASHERFAGLVRRNESPVLGITVGQPQCVFDPGKVGSYFQSERMVIENLAAVASVLGQGGQELIRILQSAVDAKKGLYVTF